MMPINKIAAKLLKEDSTIVVHALVARQSLLIAYFSQLPIPNRTDLY